MERLQKLIAKAGIASRRAAEKMILNGEVCIDGQVVTELGVQADPQINEITVRGKKLCLAEKKVYYLLNKPVGYLSSVKDDRGRKTVLDLFPPEVGRIYPVGRLDYLTEGLLLLTNDGELTNRLLHPRNVIGKTYLCTINGIIEETQLDALRKGVQLSDGITAEAETALVDADYRRSISKIKITIHEGRNRQVRRMIDAVGFKVMALRRIEFAGLNLSQVKQGKYRELTAQEVEFLYSL